MKQSPQYPIVKISDEDSAHLDNIINGGLMRKITPDEVTTDFIKRGLIYKGTGGLIATGSGHHSFMNWKKETSK